MSRKKRMSYSEILRISKAENLTISGFIAKYSTQLQNKQLKELEQLNQTSNATFKHLSKQLELFINRVKKLEKTAGPLFADKFQIGSIDLDDLQMEIANGKLKLSQTELEEVNGLSDEVFIQYLFEFAKQKGDSFKAAFKDFSKKHPAPTHVQQAIALLFKSQEGEIARPTATGLRTDGGQKLYEAWLKVSGNSRNIKREDMLRALDLLAPNSAAHKALADKIATLRN